MTVAASEFKLPWWYFCLCSGDVKLCIPVFFQTNQHFLGEKLRGQQKYIRLLKQHLQAFIRSRVHVQIDLAKCVFWPKFPQVSHDGLTRFVG